MQGSIGQPIALLGLGLDYQFTGIGRFLCAQRAGGAQRFGCVGFLGVLAIVLVFNDYQMGNYAGLVLMTFMYRTMWLRNHHETSAPG